MNYKRASLKKCLLSALIPMLAGSVQWLFWPLLAPKTWILFYPAVFFSAQIGGLVGGLIATLLSSVLGVFLFIEPKLTWLINDANNYLSLLIFSTMGILFSFSFERYHQAIVEIRRLAKVEQNNLHNTLNQALEAANAGIWEWNIKSNQCIWSENLWRLFWLEPYYADATYDLWLSTIHSDDKATVETKINTAISMQTKLNIEWRSVSKEGKERWLLSRGQPIQNDSNNNLIFQGVVIDITERKLIEFELKENERFLIESQIAAHIGSWVIYVENWQFIWSDETYFLFGLSSRTDAAPSWAQFLDLLYPDDKSSMQTWCKECLSGKQPKELEIRSRWKTGEVHWLKWIGCLETTPNGKPIRMIGTVHDITESKKILINLQASESLAQRTLAELKYQKYALDQSAIVAKTDENGNITYVNDKFCQISGYSKQELLGQNYRLINSGHHPSEFFITMYKSIASGKVWTGEICNRAKNGNIYWVLTTIVPFMGDNRKPIQYIAIQKDITIRKNTEKELKNSENQIRLAIETTGVGIWELNTITNKIHWDAQMFRIYGVAATPDGMVEYTTWSNNVLPEDLPEQEDQLRATIQMGGKNSRKFRIRRAKDGQLRHIQGVETVRRNDQGQIEWVVGTNYDITDITMAHDTLQASFNEKEALLKEVYHRVKNNLQVVSSLINLQARSVQNEEALDLLKQSADRIKAMALIHEKLYQSNDLAKIDFNIYIRSLFESLSYSLGIDENQIKTQLNITDVFLDIERAIPCGLIVNELLSNAMKHAFPNNRQGTIQIKFTHEKPIFTLIISDNGVGLPEGFDIHETSSLGMRLVSGLVANQLKGRIVTEQRNGTSYVIQFMNEEQEGKKLKN